MMTMTMTKMVMMVPESVAPGSLDAATIIMTRAKEKRSTVVGERTSPKKKCCEKSKVPNISGWRGDSFGSLGPALLARPALLLPSSHNPQTMDATAAPTAPAERPTKKLSESSAYLAEVFISYLYYFVWFYIII